MSANIEIFDNHDGRFCLTAMIEEDAADTVFAEMLAAIEHARDEIE